MDDGRADRSHELTRRLGVLGAGASLGRLVAVLAAVLSTGVLGTPGAAAAEEASPPYTVFQLPAVAGREQTAHANGLIYADYKFFKASALTDTVTELEEEPHVQISGEDRFEAAEAMNSAGEFPGKIVSGPHRGYGAIWHHGTLTLVAPTVSVVPVSAETKCRPTRGDEVNLIAINDSGQAAGNEFYSCVNEAGREGGGSIGVFWNGSELQTASGAIGTNTGVCGGFETGGHISFVFSLANSGAMTGNNCAGGTHFGRYTFSPGGTTSVACEQAIPGQQENESPLVGSYPLVEVDEEGYRCLPSALAEVSIWHEPGGGTVEWQDFDPAGTIVGSSLSHEALVGVGSGYQKLESLTAKLPTGPLIAAEHIDSEGDIVGTTDGGSYPFVAVPDPPAAPTVSEVSPAVGFIAGGTHIRIGGANLELAREVRYTFSNGDTATVKLTPFESDWQGDYITTTTPNVEGVAPGPGSIADITVVGQGGTTAVVPGDRFRFTGLEVTGVSPGGGSLEGAEDVHVTGSGLSDATAVEFELADGQTVSATHLELETDSQLTVVTPQVQPPEGDTVAVTNVRVLDSRSESPINSPDDDYVFGQPSVTSVSNADCLRAGRPACPIAGLQGRNEVTVLGKGFTQDSEARFTLQADGAEYDEPALEVNALGTEATFRTPDVSADPNAPGPLIGDVQIVTPAGASELARPGDELTFESTAVTAVTPAVGPFAGGAAVAVHGFGFEEADAVAFADSPCTGDSEGEAAVLQDGEFAVNAEGTEITLTTPDETERYEEHVPTACPGKGLQTDVIVHTPFAESEISDRDVYRFSGPVVTSVVNPENDAREGASAGGEPLLIDGYGFEGAISVDFQDASCASDAGTVSASVPSSQFTVTREGTQIELTTPDDTAAAPSACAAGRIPTDVIVDVPDSAHSGGLLRSTADPAADSFTFQAPVIERILPGEGLIGGGERIRILGKGLTSPGQVWFDYEGCGVVATPESASGGTSLYVTTPNFGEPPDGSFYPCAPVIPSGVARVDSQVRVTGFDPNGVYYDTKDQDPEGSHAEFTFNSLQVTSVRDTATGCNCDSVLGGDPVTIEGAGFPSGGASAKVMFFLGTTAVETIEVQPSSPTLIELTAPDLARLVSKIPKGKPGLSLNVVVAYQQAEGKTVESPSSKDGRGRDLYEALVPSVESVEDTATHSRHGSVFGGDTLLLKGRGLPAPGTKEASTFVHFALGASGDSPDFLGEHVAAEAVSATELRLIAPDMSRFARDVTPGQGALALNAQIELVNAEGTISGYSGFEPDGPDVYEALVPLVESVEDTATHSSHGPILGDDTLVLRGKGFATPATPSVSSYVHFANGSAGFLGEAVPAEEISENELRLTAPDMSRFAGDIPTGQGALALNAIVELHNGEALVPSSSSLEATGPDVYRAQVPRVTSVVDQATGTNGGSILGNDELTIKGSGFYVPTGGSVQVAFFDKSDELEHIEVTPVDSETIELRSPDLGELITPPLEPEPGTPEAEGRFPLNLVVSLLTGSSETGPASQSSLDGRGADVFNAEFPTVTSVEDVASGTAKGPILGGGELRVNGRNFTVPNGGHAYVEFHDAGHVIKTVPVTPASGTEILLSEPDLAVVLDQLPEHALGAEVFVTVRLEPVEGEGAYSEAEETRGAADGYEALRPVVSGVSDLLTGKSAAPMFGGDELQINGEQLVVPRDGSAQVEFYLGKDRVKTVDATPTSTSQIDVKMPDLSSLARDVHEADEGLPLDVVVVLSEAGELEGAQASSLSEYDGEGADRLVAQVPVVRSVAGATTEKPSGAIDGDEPLSIKGSGFSVPLGGEVLVGFYDGHDLVKTVNATSTTNGEEISVEAPDLMSLAGEIQPGRHGLPLNVVVEDVVSDPEGIEPAGIPSYSDYDGTGEDAYEALLPSVEFAQDTATHTNASPIVGGDQIVLRGLGVSPPSGGTARVAFEGAAGVLKTVTAESPARDELTLEAPDLSAYAAEIPEGTRYLETHARVEVEDSEGHAAQSLPGEDDAFDFEGLAITSADSARFTVGKADAFDVTTEGPHPAIHLSESGALPEGVRFTGKGDGTAIIEGTPASGSAGRYNITIAAANGVEPEALQYFSLFVDGPPSAPRQVSADAGVRSASVFWNPAEANGREITSYTVTAEPGGASVSVPGSSSRATIEGLTPGTAYTLTVTATNELGTGPSASSGGVLVTSQPAEGGGSATSSGGEGTASPPKAANGEGGSLAATGHGAGTLTVGAYSSDPVPALEGGGNFFDVSTSPGSSFSSVTFQLCGSSSGSTVDWWNPATQSWSPVSLQEEGSEPGCVAVTVNSETSPSTAQLSGTVFATAAPLGCLNSPSIALQPVAQSVTFPEGAEFSVEEGSVPPECAGAAIQWQLSSNGGTSWRSASGPSVFGADTPALLIAPTSLSENGEQVRAVLTNEHGQTASDAVALTVLKPKGPHLGLAPGHLALSTAGHAYRARLRLTGGAPPYHLTTTGALPAGLSWVTGEAAAGTLEITGTPTSVQATTITVEGSDSSSTALHAKRIYVLSVQMSMPASLGRATAGVRYSRQMAALGGTAPYSYSVSAGHLPGGLTLTQGGQLSGTPPAAGASNFAITVADSAHPAHTRTVEYTMPVQLGITPAKLPAGTVGVRYGEKGEGVVLGAFGGGAPYSLEILSGAVPGLSLVGNTLSGTPEAEGTFALDVQASDSSSPALTGTRHLTVKIKN